MDECYEAIPTAIFHGLITMLPLVQHFREDRMIVIETTQGVCSIVVWAHLILGLTVRIHFFREGVPSSELFGDGPEQIFIEARYKDHDQSITLLASSTRERLFSIKEEPDGEVIDATFKRPLRGYAKRVLSKHVPDKEGRERVIEELSLIVCSFAMCISNHLCSQQSGVNNNGIFVDSQSNDETDFDYMHTPVDREHDGFEHHIPKDRIFVAARVLFDDKKLKPKSIEDYTTKYSGRSLAHIEDPPRVVGNLLREWKDEDEFCEGVIEWAELCLVARQLSILVLATANITDLDAAAGLPLCELIDVVTPSALMMRVSAWNGIDPIDVFEDVWFEILALLMNGHTGGQVDLQTTSLISHRGWSAYVNTFGDADAAYLGNHDF
jgi:hypothetical protein